MAIYIIAPHSCIVTVPIEIMCIEFLKRWRSLLVFEKCELLKSLFQFCSAIMILLLIFQLIGNFRWAAKIFAKEGKLYANADAWKKTKHGDLAAYSEFLREQLFIHQDPDQILFVPDRKKTEVPFANKFWLGVTPLYIFPSKVIVSDNYDFVIPDEKMPFLNSLNNITYIYGNRRFHLLSNLTQKEYKKWAMFVHAADGVVDVFTLPLNYISKLGD